VTSRSGIDDKRAAVEQWTADPCGSTEVDEQPGTASYFRQLLAMRAEYGPWMAASLDYAGARDLDVLDVGCGQGIDLAQYALAGARATGVDLTPRHVELARAHVAAIGLHADVVQGDAEQLPFADATFDRVSSNGVLHHTPDMPAALREIRRVLRPGGELRAIVYNTLSLHYLFNQIIFVGLISGGLRREGSMAGVLSANVERSSIGARPLVRVYTPRAVRAALRDAGFSSVRTSVRHFHPGDAFPYDWLARRVAALRDQRLLDRIGRLAGWYVVGYGVQPDP
jgi:ubiquinone/menaquinone biosynthesis C-methylase UbiE